MIGCLLLDPSRLDETAEIVRVEDFYSDVNRRLYGRLEALGAADKPIDTKLFIDALKAAGEYEAIGGGEYIQQVLEAVAIPQHVTYYAQSVSKAAKYRRLIQAGIDIIRDGYAQAGSPEEILDHAERSLTAIGTDTLDSEPVTMRAAVLDAMHSIEQAAQKKSQGAMTGIEVVDRNTGGLFAGELTILAARPGVGKTSLACQIAHHFGCKGRPALFVSLEMAARELATRLLASLAGVSSKRIRTGKIGDADVAALARVSAGLAESAVSIYYRSSATVGEIRRRARRMARKGLSLIVVDYLQRLTPEDRRQSRYEQIGAMTRALKSLAGELKVPVLCLCQAGRDADRDSEPKLSHLRESGDIEADADVVAFLTVEAAGAMASEEAPRKAKLHYAKNRNGETGFFELLWIPYRTMFVDPDAQQPRHGGYSEFDDYSGD